MLSWYRMRCARRAAGGLALALLILVLGNGSGVYSPVDVAAAPYRFGLLKWELSNAPDKWWHKLASLLPWDSQSREERRHQLLDFFELGEEIRSQEGELEQCVALGPVSSCAELETIRDRLDGLIGRHETSSAAAQAILESEIGSVLEAQGLDSAFGVLFPPVDLVFTDLPLVLVVSPRGRIQRQSTVLLRSSIELEDMERLERKLFQEQDLAALVLGTGGVATYPSIVSGKRGLFSAADTGTHEWLHQYWFFRPLGWNYFANEAMTTLNETAADLAGAELARFIYQAITGEAAPLPEDETRGVEEEDPSVFDFDQEMRKTRLEVDLLLGQGRIEEAEAYMEQRRLTFVQNGFPIRKLNQAYFAFHGTYGSSPASVSPSQRQLERLRASVGTVGEFIRTVARFGSYAEFERYVYELP